MDKMNKRYVECFLAPQLSILYPSELLSNLTRNEREGSEKVPALVVKPLFCHVLSL